MNTRTMQTVDPLLFNDGEMAKRVRDFDWCATALGAPSTWPESLRTALGIALNSRFPMFVWWGPELINIYNDAYAPILGKRHPDALGRPARDVWGEIWPVIGPQADVVMQEGKSTWNERVALVMERNGFEEDTWFTWSYSPIPDGEGGIGGLFCACTEETGQVRTEAERDRLTEHRRLALDSAQLGWWHLDPVSGDVFWDERFKAIFGVHTDHLSYDLVIGLIHPDDQTRVHEAVQAATRPDNPQPYAIEYRVVHPDDTIHWVFASGQAYYTGEGPQRRYTSFVGTIADITERKLVEEELRQGEERLQLALAGARMGDWIWDRDSDLVYLSPRAAEIFGVPSNSTPTWTYLKSCMEPEDAVRANAAVEKSLQDHCDYDTDYRVHRPDGSTIWIAAYGHGRYNHNSDITGMVGVVQDITTRKSAEQKIQDALAAEREARSEAERVSQMKDEFLATLSHELRTPLNAMLGWASLLRSGALDTQGQQQAVETIERNARAQSQLIEDLLDMSRIISGKVRLDVQQVDLSDVVAAAIDSVLPTATTKDIRIQKVIDPYAGPVAGDPARLQQVVWNLLSNAIKFTPKGGKVQVTLERVNSHLEICISDTGIGIKPEFLPHVFDRFSQADGTTTRRHGGLGLGLAIVKQIVEMHNGTVRAKSPGEGDGSTFIVDLPLAIAHHEASENRLHPRATSSSPLGLEDLPNLTGIKVLVVDDEPDARELAKRVLNTANAEVVTAESALHALALLPEFLPDVILSDIGMPDVDGYEFIRRVRRLDKERGGTIPAIALTAFARSEDRRKALLSGYQNHLSKPLDAAELVTVVASAAGRVSSLAS